MSRYFRIHFCFPIVHPTAPTSLQIQTNIKEHLSLNILKLKCLLMLTSFVGLVGAIGHTVGIQKRVHVVPRHVLVSYRVVFLTVPPNVGNPFIIIKGLPTP